MRPYRYIHYYDGVSIPVVQTSVDRFTVDGVVSGRSTKTFTVDGIVKVTSTKTFTTDGIIEVATDSVISGSISASGYKWLTQSLQNAQQSFAVRPYQTVKIVDDQVLANQDLGGTAAATYSSTAIAPDGSIWMLGQDSSGNLAVWKITDGTQVAQWANTSPTVVLVSSGDYIDTQNTSIKISEYINGTYYIDVYYWTNVSDALHLMHQRSSNGGASFAAEDLNWNTGIDADGGDNFYLGSVTPTILSDNTVDAAGFYIMNTQTAGYQIRYIYFNGTSWAGSAVNWTRAHTDSQDWVLHSFDTYRDPLTGFVNIVFSGYHTVLESTNGQYSLYFTRLVALTGGQLTDIWTYPKEIQPSLSPSTQNLNSFVTPSLNWDGSFLWLIFKGTTVATVSGDSTVTTEDFVYITRSVNFEDFEYPTAAIVDGNAVVVSNIGESVSFPAQDGYYYLVGDSGLAQYQLHSYTADVSTDVTGLQIQESAGGPSSLTLQIGNQSGKWAGPSPTGSGYQAIAKGKKVVIYQGYYNSLGVPEVVPRNTYYIDDIKQLVDANNNTLSISARDFSKLNRQLVTKFNYNYDGPESYVDTFDGTTLNNWNQQAGNWIEADNRLVITNPLTTSSVQVAYPPNTGTADFSLDNNIFLSGANLKSFAYIFSCIVTIPSSRLVSGGLTASRQEAIVYCYWEDPNNWLRLRFSVPDTDYVGPPPPPDTSVLYYVERMQGGSFSRDVNGVSVSTYFPQNYDVPVYIICNGYNYFQIILGQAVFTGSNSPANNVNQFTTFTGQRDDNIDVGGTTPVQGNGVRTVGMATVNMGSYNGGVNSSVFSEVKLLYYSNSLNIQEAVKALATKSGVNKYKNTDVFNDFLSTSSNFTGTFTLANRTLSVSNSNLAMRNVSQISDGEIVFKAKINPPNPGSNYGLDFIFRSQSSSNATQCYYIRVLKRLDSDSANVISAQLHIVGTNSDFPRSTGGDYILMSTIYEAASLSNNAIIDINFDLTVEHEYRVTFSLGWITLFIDGVMVLSWFDDNAEKTWTTGYIGFRSMNSNSPVTIYSLSSPLFFQQVSAFGINPGDDIDSSISHLFKIARGWVFSDLFGRLKLVQLVSGSSSYTYQDQLMAHSVDNSDKEYVNQVTVIGDNGVSAIARDVQSIQDNAIIRDLVVIDYKIKTLADAQTRATYELNDANKFNTQSDPKQVINVGAELFDIVHIIDTDPNTTGLDETLRVYNQTITVDGRATEWSIQIGTGTIT